MEKTPTASANVIKDSHTAVLRGVTYDVYVALCDNPRNDHLRMTYHDGVLEIVSPAYRHERGSTLLALVIRAYAASTGLECLGAGSTTFRKGLPGQLKGKGKEPDESFYFTHLDVIGPKDTIDLNVDPPPDLWIEVDNRASSAGKLPLYAALGIVEVWRYRPRRRRLWIGRLADGSYSEVDESRCLPGLTPTLLLEFLDEARTRGETAWDVWLRAWIAERAPHFAERRAALGA
ncbi:MAG: Uma2 family endonuclease [Planctomycetia bacterium]|nr:Uma2 family endonuclease [Planctomycetia bacterium]